MSTVTIPQNDLFYRFGIALVIGILIGMEREHSGGTDSRKRYAGVRTFTLIALTGCAGALASDIMNSPWPLVTIFLLTGGLNAVGYMVTAVRGRVGGTTEVAAILTLILGALCYWDYLTLATAIAVTMTLLLSLKWEIHRIAHGIDRDDIYAALKLAVISAIVLPVLPNQSYGPPPFDVFNPHRIWLMVVFVSAISFAGYVLMQVVSARHGIGLTGFLGGFVSSTAATLSLSKHSHSERSLARVYAMAITIAWTTMFLRILIQVAVVNYQLLPYLWLPMLAPTLLASLYAGWLYWHQREVGSENIELANPFELRPAITFGLIFAFILFITRAAITYFGESGLYFTGIVAGFAEANAITLTMAQLSSGQNALEPHIAVNTIVFAAISNTIVKTVIVMTVGVPGLRRMIWPSTLIIVAALLGAIFLF